MNASDLPDETLFEGALKCRTPEERAAYLDQHCAGQPALRRNLEALLAAHDQSGEFLEPTVAAARPTIKLDLAPEETPGTMIGRYKLLQKIGEGGMGVVYMAEQTEPVVRKVALKIIKLGMDTKAVVARFEAERQALALMDHPNIAKVLDAGAVGLGELGSSGRRAAQTSEVANQSRLTSAATIGVGRPYFVMELVHGVPITEYCDKNKLITQERLELFIPVCQAIQHAHQKGIIHRDIKPSNVMVTLHDGVPVPKVIDFGVAKATNQRLTEKTLFTHYAQMIGTPAYMSPEQAEMSGLDIDTRSDIYSLGVLLYELLTGSTPFTTKDLLSKGYAEMQRIIAEQEPPKPSTRMSTLREEEKTVVAKNRNMDAGSLRRGLQGDLDWIVMKCLEKDRTRRYETSNGLAADLRRHLSNELITARPPTTGYLLKKLIKRNRLAFTASAAVAVALVIGIAVSTWQAVRANREARRAVRAEALAKERLAESEAITKFLTGVFQSPDPARDGRTITVVETLAKAVTQLETELADQSARRAMLQQTLANTYEGLGLNREATDLREKVLASRRATLGSKHPDTLDAMANLANSYSEVQRAEEALKLREELLQLRTQVLGPEARETLRSLQDLAGSLDAAGRLDEGLRLREQAYLIARKRFDPEDPDRLGATYNVAVAYSERGRAAEAVPLQEELLVTVRKVFSPKHPRTLLVMSALANSYSEVGKLSESLKMKEELLALHREVFGREHPKTLECMKDLALSYHFASRQTEAIQLQEETLALFKKVRGPENPRTLGAMHNLANSYHDAGRLEEAARLFQETLLLSRRVEGPEHPDTLAGMTDLARCLADLGQLDEAIDLQKQSLELKRRVLPPTHRFIPVALQNLALFYERSGRAADALPLREEALALERKTRGPEHPFTLQAMQNLANTYGSLDRREEAVRTYEAVLALRRRALGEDAMDTLSTMLSLAACYRSAGRTTEAMTLGQSLLEHFRKTSGQTNINTLNAMTELAISYRVAGRTEEATLLETDALRLKRQHLPPGHPLAVESMDNLATCYEQSNRKPEAEALRRELAELKAKAESQKPAAGQSPIGPAKP